MRTQRAAKVTISLPKDLLDIADRLAQEQAISRSEVIARLLEKEEETRIQRLMAEGYREMAEEDRRLAEAAFPMVSESLERHAPWDDRTEG